jgi:hypothetical protein
MWLGGFQNKIAVRIFLDHTVHLAYQFIWTHKFDLIMQEYLLEAKATRSFYDEEGSVLKINH